MVCVNYWKWWCLSPQDVNVFLLVVVCWPYLRRSADVAFALGISTSPVSGPFPFILLSLLKIKDVRLELPLLNPGKIGPHPSACHHFVTSPWWCLKLVPFGKNSSPGFSKELGPSVPLGKLEYFSRTPPRLVLFGIGQWLSWCQETALPGEVWAEQGQFSSNGRKKSYSCIGTNGTILKNHHIRRVNWALMHLHCNGFGRGVEELNWCHNPSLQLLFSQPCREGALVPLGCGGLNPAAVPWTFRAQIWVLLSKVNLAQGCVLVWATIGEHRGWQQKEEQPFTWSFKWAFQVKLYFCIDK